MFRATWLTILAAVLGGVLWATPSLGAGDVPSAAAGEGRKTWEVEGVMYDACQCQIFCPCEFMRVPTFGHCGDAALLHIEKGRFGDVLLDGLNVVAVTQSREGKRVVDTMGDLTFARIFVPSGTSEAQAEALAEVARRAFGAFVNQTARISPDEKVEKVPVEVTLEAGHGLIRIPNVLELEMETLKGGDEKSPIVIQNLPFSAAGFGDAQVGQSKVYRYTYEGRDWDYGGRSASIRAFTLGGEI